MIHILLTEDDQVLARIIQYYLHQEGFYEVTWAKTAGEALAVARQNYDVILLDVKLPDVSGIELCEELRQWHRCPIIFISCLDDSDTIIRSLEAGGDDFIPKPFDNKVLAAKIRANLRRVQESQAVRPTNQLVCSSFTLDIPRQSVQREEGEYTLSQTEFSILSYLMLHPNQFFTADDLYRQIWGKNSYGDSRTVMVHIHNIRQKIGDTEECQHIKNTWGKGYYFDPNQ